MKKNLKKEKELRYDEDLKEGERERQPGGGRKGNLITVADKLFYILFYFKCYPTFDVIGLMFDLDRSNACRNVHKLIPILNEILKEAMVLPKRQIHTTEELFELFPVVHDLFIDATERQIPRPKNKHKQKENYSGKKKRHTKKNTIISDENREIRYLGPTVEGKKHDYRTFTDEFPTEPPPIPPPETPPLPGDFRFWTDPAYIGIEKDFPWLNVIITSFHSEILNKFKMPMKKPKGRDLTQHEKHLNKLISGIRVKVEHAIGGVKRFGIVSNIFRNKTDGLDDKVMEISCGLWNYHLLSS
ncbi:transposase [groundwater metagenome]|uniref:Transposase n=1 Tax=groundwater metagenome TaxID=717931 RepID=A0A098EAS9_9ZZZZ